MSEEQRPYVSIPPAMIDEHHYRCPTCHQVIDVRDLDEAAKHLEPGHQAPAGSAQGRTCPSRKVNAPLIRWLYQIPSRSRLNSSIVLHSEGGQWTG